MAFLDYVQVNALRHWTLILLGLVSLRLLFNKFRKHLRSIPGPVFTGCTNFGRFFDCLTATPHKTHIDLHRKYQSKFIRIGPRTISVSDTTLIPRIQGLNSALTKTKFYTLHMLPYKGQFTLILFTILDEDYHAKFRRPIANAYSTSTLVEFEPLIETTTSLFMKRLDEYAASERKFNLGVWLQMFAFDVIGIIADIRSKMFRGGAIGQIPAIDAVLTKNHLSLMVADTHPVVKFTVKRMLERQNSKQKAVGPLDDTLSTERQSTKDFLAR